MGMDKQEKNLAEAMRENAVMKYEEDYTEKYEGFDPSSAESYIIFSLMQHADFDQSLLLAQSIQKQYKVATAMADRGAKQGPFYVLWKPAMPRVLTEMGFLSNEQDRRYLNSEKGRVALALALYTAFDEYKQAVEKTPTSSTGSAPTKPAPAQKPAPAKEPAKADTGVAFYVQLSASRGRISTDDKLFDGVGGKVIEKHVGGWYKYYLGGYSNLNDATDAKDKARISGFKEAYVIAMDGDTPITIDDARRRLGKK
jgi:N-acetylmuramoyl-L-alanine amidase